MYFDGGLLRSVVKVQAEADNFSSPGVFDDAPPAELLQFWSLTQFFSVDFSQSRRGVKKYVFNNAKSRFASVVVDGVLGPPRLAGHT